MIGVIGAAEGFGVFVREQDPAVPRGHGRGREILELGGQAETAGLKPEAEKIAAVDRRAIGAMGEEEWRSRRRDDVGAERETAARGAEQGGFVDAEPGVERFDRRQRRMDRSGTEPARQFDGRDGHARRAQRRTQRGRRQPQIGIASDHDDMAR